MRATSSMEDVRVFDNFSIYPQQYWGGGRMRGRMGWNPRLDPFSKLRSRSRGRERERSGGMEGKEEEEGEEKEISRPRRVRLTFSIGELFAHGRRYIQGKLLPRKSLQSLVVGKLIDQTIALPFPSFLPSFLPSIRPASPPSSIRVSC